MTPVEKRRPNYMRAFCQTPQDKRETHKTCAAEIGKRNAALIIKWRVSGFEIDMWSLTARGSRRKGLCMLAECDHRRNAYALEKLAFACTDTSGRGIWRCKCSDWVVDKELLRGCQQGTEQDRGSRAGARAGARAGSGAGSHIACGDGNEAAGELARGRW